MKSLEWPPDSGRVASYSPDELVFIRRFIRQREDGKITTDEMARQIGHFHDLKVEFGVDLHKDVVE